MNDQSIIFIDEIESALHPDAICKFLDMIYEIADKMGVQVFIATHSYFVIKKLVLLAMKKKGFITCISLKKDGTKPFINDLHDGMPDNSIIDTSIQLYEQEIEEGLEAAYSAFGKPYSRFMASDEMTHCLPNLQTS